MIVPDNVLMKIRLLENNLQEAENSSSQSLEEFKKEVKDFYKSEGINVSDKVLNFIINTFGLDYVKNPEVVNITKNIMKNPSRFVLNSMEQLNLNFNDIQEKIKNKVSNDNPEKNNIVNTLTQLLKTMISVESHVSGTHSIMDTISSDLYSRNETEKMLLDAINKLANINDETKKMFAKWISAQRDSKKGKHPLYGKDLTGKKVIIGNGADPNIFGKEGTVIIDSEDKNLSQEYLDKIAEKISNIIPDIHFDLKAIKKTRHRTWVLIPSISELIDIDKSLLMIDMFKPLVNTIVERPNLFRLLVTLTNDEDRDKIYGAVTGAEASRNRAHDIARRVGFDVDKHRSVMGLDKQDRSRFIHLPINASSSNSQSLKLFSWLVSKNSTNVQIRHDEVNVAGRFENGVLTNPEFIIHFYSMPPKLTNIQKMTIYIGDIEELRKYARKESMNINIQPNPNKGIDVSRI